MVDWAALRVMAWDAVKASGVVAGLLAVSFLFRLVGEAASPEDPDFIVWPALEYTFYGLVIVMVALVLLAFLLAGLLSALDGLAKWHESAKRRARGDADA